MIEAGRIGLAKSIIPSVLSSLQKSNDLSAADKFLITDEGTQYCNKYLDSTGQYSEDDVFIATREIKMHLVQKYGYNYPTEEDEKRENTVNAVEGDDAKNFKAIIAKIRELQAADPNSKIVIKTSQGDIILPSSNK